MTGSPVNPRIDSPKCRSTYSTATAKRAVPNSRVVQASVTPTERGEDRTDSDGTLIIDPAGDIILDVADGEAGKEVVSYRVSSAPLMHASGYFRTLLSSDAFAEGATITKTHEELRARYMNLADAPITELPRLKIFDAGRIGAVKSIRPLMKDFLQILHAQDMSIRKPPLSNIVNLAIVADRFDAIGLVGEWIRKRWPLGKAPTDSYTEESSRQRLLVGMIFDYEPWIAVPSFQLVCHGSSQWTGNAKNRNPLWWDMPFGLEGSRTSSSV